MNISENITERIAADIAELVLRETITIMQNGEPVTLYKDDLEKALYRSLLDNIAQPMMR